MTEVILYTQYPIRSASPSIPSYITLKQNGEEVVLASYTTLGNSLKALKDVLKKNNIKMSEVEVREERAKACTHVAELSGNKPEITSPALSVDRRFELMGRAVRMVSTGALPSCFIVGQGGLGKTYTVKQHLKLQNRPFVDAIVGDIPHYDAVSEENGSADDSIVYVKGSVSTAFALYQILHNHRDQTIVFDDCDNVLNNDTQVNILKAVLDSDEDRKVSWMNKSASDMGYDTSFEFTGNVIFISNKRMEDVPQAIRSRSTLIDLTLSEVEVFDRIRSIGMNMGNASAEEVSHVVDTMWKHRRSLKEISLRTFGKALAFHRQTPEDLNDVILFLL